MHKITLLILIGLVILNLVILLQNYQVKSKKKNFKQKKVAILMPWTGKLPQSINYTIATTRNTKFYEWFIFQDVKDKSNESLVYSKNFHIIHIPKLMELYYEKLFNAVNPYHSKYFLNQLKRNPEKPWDLNKYKPIFWEMFKEFIPNYKKYTHWAFGDLDCIYGDLDYFTTKEMLTLYDFFTFGTDRNLIYLRGSLTVMKINKEKYFLACPEYQKIVQGFASYVGTYDESCFSPNVIRRGHTFYISTSQFEDAEPKDKPYFLRWKNGRLLYHRDSFYSDVKLPNSYRIPLNFDKECHHWWPTEDEICGQRGNIDFYRNKKRGKIKGKRSQIGEEYAFYHFPYAKQMKYKNFTANPESSVFNIIYSPNEFTFSILEEKD